jgi:hypothetical protein
MIPKEKKERLSSLFYLVKYVVYLPLAKCITAAITNKTKNIKNIILAIPADAPAIPLKPKAPAIKAMIKNISA